MGYLENYEKWCSDTYFDEKTREELKALKGMEQTILKYKPKLAICIYHKFEDLWELPLYIKKLVPEYKLYIRNYTTYLDEIVLYATI